MSEPSDPTFIEVKLFPKFYSSIDRDYIANEYQKIEGIDVSKLSRTYAKNEPHKNRYSNIMPYDFNRVLLKRNEFCDSDYMNASYIDGHKKKNCYIATQGPLETTEYDFWHMIVEHNCHQIVMLGPLCENAKTKCYKYFPGKGVTFKLNNLTITKVKKTDFENFVKRVFTVSKGQAQRTVCQYHFIAWPDHGCPQNELALIEFIKLINRENPIGQSCPMVVHCSAGVGRTGTFIALDIILTGCRSEKFISIFDTVKKLRLQRDRMVQTVAQYQFLYDSVNAFLCKSNV